MEAGTLLAQREPVATRSAAPSLRVEDFERIEEYLCAYLEEGRFTSRYPRAEQRWSDAWAMLWRANSTDKVVAVANEAREVMSEFVAALVDLHGPHQADPGSTGTLEGRTGMLESRTGILERLSAVIEMYRPALGDSRCGLLQTLFDYWQALGDAVQHHHEHRAGRVLGRLTWEDGRRVIVLTAIVMVEVDRSL